MKSLQLTSYGKIVDDVEASIARLQDAIYSMSTLYRLEVFPSTVPTGMESTGRQVGMSLTNERGDSCLPLLWNLAAQAGFVPYDRWPCEDSATRFVFHAFGPWSCLLDGRFGDPASTWVSLVRACKVDVGSEVPMPRETLIQAYLHRRGFNVGPIDGNLQRPSCVAALRHLPFAYRSLPDLWLKIQC